MLDPQSDFNLLDLIHPFEGGDPVTSFDDLCKNPFQSNKKLS